MCPLPTSKTAQDAMCPAAQEGGLPMSKLRPSLPVPLHLAQLAKACFLINYYYERSERTASLFLII